MPSINTNTPAAGTATVLSIWNRALGSIGTRTTVASINENSNEARNCAIMYDGVRDQLLRAARWDFASGMATLTLLKAAPGTPENPVTTSTPSRWTAAMPQLPWLYSYAYPSDCMNVRRIPLQGTTFNGDVPLTTAPNPMWGTAASPVSSARFTVAQDIDPLTGAPIKNILTNSYQAIAAYTRQTTDATTFDATFTEALVQALAGKLAMALTGDKTIEKTKYQIADNLIIQARVADGNEGTPQIDHFPDWLQVRAGGIWGYGTLGGGYLFEPYGPGFGGLC